MIEYKMNNKQKELANGLYIMLEKKENGFDKNIQVEIIGKLMLEAKKYNIAKILLYLFDLYFQNIARDMQAQIRSNRGVIYEAEKD